MRIFHKPETFVSLFVEQLVCVISCNMSKTQIDPRIRQLKIKIGVVKRLALFIQLLIYCNCIA